MRIRWYFDYFTGNIKKRVYLKKRKGVIIYSYKLTIDCDDHLEINSTRKVLIRNTPHRNVIKTIHRWYGKDFEWAEEGDWK